MTLKKKLVFSLMVILLAPLIIIGSSIYGYLYSERQKEALDTQTSVLEQVHASMQSELMRLSQVSEQLSNNVTLRHFHRETPFYKSPKTIDPAMRELFKTYLSINSNLDEIQLLDTQGRYIAGVSISGDISRMTYSRPLLMLAAEKTIIRFHNLANQPKVISLTPIILDGGQAAGFVLTTIKLETLEALMAIGHASNHQFYLSSTNGQLITSALQHDAMLLPPELIQSVKQHSNTTQLHQGTLLDLSTNFGVRPLNPDIWLASVVDNTMIQKDSEFFLTIIMPAITAIMLLIGAVLYSLVVRTIIIPLQRLIDATNEVATGNYTPGLEVKNRDEMGLLASSFNDMGHRLEESNKKVVQLAYFDSLTKLPNRNTLKHTLENLIIQASRKNTMLAVLFIDLDDFKKVNDRLGHVAGDELLIAISKRLQKNLRIGDLVAEGEAGKKSTGLLSRRGGDEFNAILTNVRHTREVGLIAERIINDINKPVQLKAGSVVVGASIGIALYPNDGIKAETLLHNADMAMYDAKSKGKNNYQVYTAETNDMIHTRLNMEQAMARALKNNHFTMQYQPKVDLITMEVTGFEALVRWTDDKRGVISPAEFIPVAEESQLIHDIGNWVLAEVLHQIKLWESNLPAGLRVAINISAQQLKQPNFAEDLIDMAAHFGVPLSRVEVEITETSVLSDETLVKKHLHALRYHGVKVSLDDFGTGYSSLTFLSRLPIDVVKIDSSFVFDLMQSKDNQAIVSSVLELCQKLSLETVAEGIEDPAQLAFLMSHSCTEGQGYLFAKPLTDDKVLKFIAEPTYLAL